MGEDKDTKPIGKEPENKCERESQLRRWGNRLELVGEVLQITGRWLF